MANIFGKAKQKAAPKTKKDDKLRVAVQGEEFAENLKIFATMKSQIDELTAQLEMAKSYVKNVGVEEFAKIVEKTKTNVGSFILTSDKGGNVMFLPTKKYITVDEERATILKETYGEDVVNEDTTYAFNNEVLMRNQDAIAKLIENSNEISQDDKDNLINATTKYTVKEDSLDKVYTLAKESGKNVSEVLEDIKPVYMLKSPNAGK